LSGKQDEAENDIMSCAHRAVTEANPVPAYRDSCTICFPHRADMFERGWKLRNWSRGGCPVSVWPTAEL